MCFLGYFIAIGCNRNVVSIVRDVCLCHYLKKTTLEFDSKKIQLLRDNTTLRLVQEILFNGEAAELNFSAHERKVKYLKKKIKKKNIFFQFFQTVFFFLLFVGLVEWDLLFALNNFIFRRNCKFQKQSLFVFTNLNEKIQKFQNIKTNL